MSPRGRLPVDWRGPRNPRRKSPPRIPRSLPIQPKVPRKLTVLVNHPSGHPPPEATAPHRKVYPRAVRGNIRTIRWWLTAALQAILFFGPWLTWKGRQAVLFDLDTRHFYFFALNFWPQETYFLLIILVFAALLLFASTAVAGRVWCGYACPQTLLTESFILVEGWIEGERARAIKLDREPWHARKIALKALKYGVWTVMAIWLGITFVAYFTPGNQLLVSLMLGQAAGSTVMAIAFFAGLALFDFGFFREQFCHYLCPYARFQGSMFDSDTLLVAFDRKRGEPRGKVGTGNAGDCVDCSLCVQVCPMGVDIRDGNQLECINCTACLDACNSVMDRIGKPRGLVHYTSQNAEQGKKTHFLRPRVLVYATLLLALAGLFTYLMATRKMLEMAAVRGVTGGNVFAVTADGRISNLYKLKIINKENSDRTLLLSLDGFPGADLVTAKNPLVIPADTAQVVSVLVVHSPKGLPPVQRFRIRAEDADQPAVRGEAATSFIGPGM